MNTTLLATMLFVSLLVGLLGLIAFLWGLKSGQFDDQKKFTSGALFDGVDALNIAAKKEEKKQTLQKEKKNANL